MRSARIDRILALIDSVLEERSEATPQVVVQRLDGSQVVVPFRTRDARPAA
jgi:hypothetical protein